MILYEYPFNESIRTMLRLELLFGRLITLIARDDAVDHHFALATLFDVIEVASRADLKSDLLMELDRHKTQLQAYRGHPGVSEEALDAMVAQVETAHDALNQTPGKAGAELAGNEWLTAVRSRIHIPAGTCEFDLPGYHAWQQQPPETRRADLEGWAATLAPLAQALHTLLRLIRDSGVPHRVVVQGGSYQQSLPPGKSYQLLRLRIDPQLGLVPEMAGHRLMVSVRLLRGDADGRLRITNEDATVDMALCGSTNA